MQFLKISLAAARVNADYTLDAAAGEIGVSKKTLINWEKGRAVPDVPHQLKIGEVYQFPVDNIIFAPQCTKSAS